MTSLRRATALLLSPLLVAALVVASLGSAEASTAAPRHPRSDTATAGADDFFTLRPADVVTGSTDNHLVVRYTAGRRLTDGTVRVVLPSQAWRTPLRPVDLLFDDASPGAFSVRPAVTADGQLVSEPAPGSADSCRPVESGSWHVRKAPGAQVIVVRHVTCAAGQELTVRTSGVDAPRHVGKYVLPIISTSPRQGLRLTAARIRVVPTPSTRLTVSVPAHIQADVPFAVTVRATRPDGSLDTSYRGGVDLVSQDAYDCSTDFRGRGVGHQFTAADRGVAAVRFRLDTSIAHRIRAYDVGRRAVDGVSRRLTVSGPFQPIASCPVTYH